MGSIRTRLFALPLAGVSLLALVGAAGCEKSDPSVSFTPEFVPVTFTLDASGKISVSVGRSFVTPIGTFSVDGGAEHQFATSPKGYLTTVIRYLDKKLGLVESGYLVHTDHKVEPALDGVALAPAKGILRADFTHRKTGGELKISDTRQNTPVPTASASSCPAGESVPVTLPKVSAGDSVADTVAALSAVCLAVQYAIETADRSDGTVSRVVIPTVPEGSVQLPPAAEGAPGPGDKVTASTVQAATVYVAGPAGTPSPSATDGSSSPTDSSPSPEDTPDATPDALPTGTTGVRAEADAPVRSAPSTTGAQVSSVVAGNDYPALCARQGEEVTAHGRTSGVWVQLRLADGGTGWATATAFAGETGTLASC
ncbi:SH3 domain-containing protein [Streptomyces sp. NPDC101151]|uniref:SH3 domain-containing protein n=1 Tax=Streptomyces sp. NPDC101151 TaxID=3366115 RepID=UPI0037F1C546